MCHGQRWPGCTRRWPIKESVWSIKSKAGQLVGLVCSKRGNLVFLGTKFVTASGGCTCVGDPRVGGSRDQCGVSRSHEIMSTVAFLYR